MSRFTQEQQTEIVEKAKNLTATILIEEETLEEISNQRFKGKPNAPIRQTVEKCRDAKPKYPPKPKANYAFIDYLKELWDKFKSNKKIVIGVIVLFVLMPGLLVFIGWGLLIAFLAYRKKLKELNNELANSEEYLKAVAEEEQKVARMNAELDKQMEAMQKEFDEKYEKALAHYNEVTIPQYEEEKRKWQVNKDRKIGILNEEIKLNKEALSILYDDTKIISSTYRELWILSWLYEDMSTSDHDIRYATELLDKERLMITIEKTGMIVESAVNQLEDSMLREMQCLRESVDYGNSLQEETIDVLSKTRRDMNIGNIVGTVQRHNTNKMLEELVSKKKK